MKNLIANILLFITVIFFSSTAFAYQSPWQGTEKDEGKLRLVYAGESEGKIYAGLEFEFKGNWHTYWKYSGDSGMPVTIENKNSENIKSIETIWPVPTRDDFYGVESWAYHNHVIIPLVITPSDIEKDVTLNLNIKYAVCDEVCLFSESNFSNRIPSGEINEGELKRINKFIELSPAKHDDIKFQRSEFDDKQLTIELVIPQDKLSINADMFISEATKNFRFPKPKKIYDEATSVLKFIFDYEVKLKGQTLKGKELEITLSNGENSVSQNINGNFTSNTKVPSRATSTTLIAALIAAFIGGLILNIMPCVLPVISLKIFGVMKHGAKDKKFIRKSFFYSSLGIIFSFIVLALAVIILKYAGHSIGWGIQFQQPYFIIFLMLLVTLFAANQWGWFEVLLPTKLGDKINQAIENHGESTPFGNFLTGAFATLLATPCTAPFLTTAVSFAFAGSNWNIILIFIVMGFGLAFPYILLMLFPRVARSFPKPGKWMAKVKIFLGFLLYFTNFWLIYVLFNSAGYFVPIIVVTCIHVLLLLLYIAKWKNLDRVRTIAATVWVIIATFGLTHYLISGESFEKSHEDKWVNFDEQKIPEYISAGKVVYVDVTADWCLTCKFNKIRVINQMMDFFDDENVILMKADFTKPSEPIYNYLVKNGTYAIPFNKVYGPAASDGIRLKEILDQEIVRKAVFDAKGE